ncbi:hypothetical protein GQ457_12G013330 [Hibiscus cannabinus]
MCRLNASRCGRQAQHRREEDTHRVPLLHTMCELMAPRCGRQAHRGREEGPLGCYYRTPCVDSMPLGAGGKHTIGGKKTPIGCPLSHTMCELMAPRCGRQAHRGREEGPLGCYYRTPCADSMPLGAGGRHTIGGRKTPIGCPLSHTMCELMAPRCGRQAHRGREEGPLGCYYRTPCADSMPLGAGGRHTIGGRKTPIGCPLSHTMCELMAPRCGRQAHRGWEEGPLGCYYRTPCADSMPLGAGGKHTIGGRKTPIGSPLSHTMCELMAPRCGRQAHRGREEGPLGCYYCTPYADSMPLGAGGKHTIGGRKAPSGANPAHHMREERPPLWCYSRTPFPVSKQMAFFLSISLSALFSSLIWNLLLDVILPDLRCYGLHSSAAVVTPTFFRLNWDGLAIGLAICTCCCVFQISARAVFCARVVVPDYRDFYPSWLTLRFNLFGRRSWTVQGLGASGFWVSQPPVVARFHGSWFWPPIPVVTRILWLRTWWQADNAVIDSALPPSHRPFPALGSLAPSLLGGNDRPGRLFLSYLSSSTFPLWLSLVLDFVSFLGRWWTASGLSWCLDSLVWGWRVVFTTRSKE